MTRIAGTNFIDSDIVRSNTAPAVNLKIQQCMRERIVACASKSPAELTKRIHELEREWDIERVLEANASTLAFTGLAFGALFNRKWLLLPALVLPFLFLHAVQGWCPPIPALRRLGVRTRREIDAETYALRLLRGDFDSCDRTQRALKAIEPELTPVEG
ncbi:MAG TPA: hypothetical protein VK530_20710 [Candidatus Acidoferrum sp.]|nr:hypothetical protein [Candidatus Acidoferrum sp.]